MTTNTDDAKAAWSRLGRYEVNITTYRRKSLIAAGVLILLLVIYAEPA